MIGQIASCDMCGVVSLGVVCTKGAREGEGNVCAARVCEVYLQLREEAPCAGGVGRRFLHSLTGRTGTKTILGFGVKRESRQWCHDKEKV